MKKFLGVKMLMGVIFFSAAQLSAELKADEGKNFTVSDSSGTTVFDLKNPSTNQVEGANDCTPGAVFDYVDKYLVRLEKTAPSAVSLNEDYSYNYIVTAKDKLKKVVITEQIPAKTKYVSSNPAAQIDGATVTWTLYNLEAGEIVPLELVVNATAVSDFSNCATIVAYPEACTTTSVGVPALAIEKKTPAENVLLNSEVPWSVTVTNTGNFCAYDVVITDALPEGIIHESGNSNLVGEIGTLAPGESREMHFVTAVAETGQHSNAAVVTASNAEPAQDEARIVVLESGLEITKVGPEMQFVGKKASYTIIAKNTGDIPFNDIVITDEVPAANELREAPGSEIDGNVALWTTDLAPGEEKSFDISVLGLEEGTYCNEVDIVTSEYSLSSSDSACTEWRGYPALLIEVIDTEDPLLVGEETTYIIQITNQGTAADTNVELDVKLPDSLSIVSASGDTQGEITGNNIAFAPYPVLNAKEIIQFRVIAKAIAEGDSRFRAEMKSDLLSVPVPEEESTQVY